MSHFDFFDSKSWNFYDSWWCFFFFSVVFVLWVFCCWVGVFWRFFWFVCLLFFWFFFCGELFSLPKTTKERKKGAKVVLKDVIFARWISTDLSFIPRWPGASLSGGGHFNMPRCEVDIKTTLSASLN